MKSGSWSVGWGRTVRDREDGSEELRHVKKIRISGGNLSTFAPYARDQSCGGANQEDRPPNGSKVLQRSGSSVINNGWLSR